MRWKTTENGTYYDGCLTNAARSVLHNAKPGLVVDVGANIGWLSLFYMYSICRALDINKDGLTDFVINGCTQNEQNAKTFVYLNWNGGNLNGSPPHWLDLTEQDFSDGVSYWAIAGGGARWAILIMTAFQMPLSSALTGSL